MTDARPPQDEELRAALIPLATYYADHLFHPEDHQPDDDCWVNLYRAIVGLDKPEVALRAEATRDEGLDERRIAAAILASNLTVPDGIPPHRWDLYAGTIAKELAYEYRAAALATTEQREGLDAELVALAMHEAVSSQPGLGDRPDLWRSSARQFIDIYDRLAAARTSSHPAR